MPGLVIFKGLDEGGQTVTVLGGEPLPEDVAKVASDFTGAPLGTPKAGTVLTRVGEMEFSPTVKRCAMEDMMYQPEPEPIPDPEPHPVEKRVQLQNAAMLGPLCLSLKVNTETEEMGLATGIVMEPSDGSDGEGIKADTQGQVSSAEDIEKAAIYWACNGGAIDLMHSFEVIMDERVDVVETWIARAEFDLGGYTVKKGTWLMTTKWQTNGKYWAAIKSGEFNAYSIGGLGETLPFGGGEGGE